MNNTAFNQSKERGLLLRLDYLKKVFVTLFPEYPEPSRESLLRWSVFDTSIVERAMAIIAVRFAKRAPLDVYKTITQEARDQSYVQRRRAKLEAVESAEKAEAAKDEDLAIRYGLEKTSIRNDREKLRVLNAIDKKTFESLPPVESLAVAHLAEREELHQKLSRKLSSIRDEDAIRASVTVENMVQFYRDESGALKARLS